MELRQDAPQAIQPQTPQPQTPTPPTPTPPIPQQNYIHPLGNQTGPKKKVSLKVQIVGFFLIAASAVMIFGFLLSMLMFFADGVDAALISGILGLVLGIYGFILGSSIRHLKKWSWYAGLITFGLAGIGNLITLAINFDLLLIIPIILEVLPIYFLLSEKGEFLANNQVA